MKTKKEKLLKEIERRIKIYESHVDPKSYKVPDYLIRELKSMKKFINKLKWK